MSPKRLWFVTHCLACRYLSVFWKQRSWQCWGLLLETHSKCMYTCHRYWAGTPFFWFEGQLERCYKWRDLSDASPSLPDLVLWGFLYFGEFFLEVSDTPMLLRWEGLCFVFKNQGVKVQCACTFFHCHNQVFCESLEEFTVHGLQNYSKKSV